MHKGKSIDIIDKILQACYNTHSYSLFIMSLMHQYEERGFLTKKQMEGLLKEAKKVNEMPENWMATLEAMISKMPNRYKSPEPAAKPLFEKDDTTGKLIHEILVAYPQHKRVLFLQAKFQNNTLTETEKKELVKLHGIVIKKQ